jgi:hypothetical protein
MRLPEWQRVAREPQRRAVHLRGELGQHLDLDMRGHAGNERNADAQLAHGMVLPLGPVLEIDAAVDEPDVEQRELRRRRIALGTRRELVQQVLEVVGPIGIAHHAELRLRERDLVHHRREAEDRSPRHVHVELVEAGERRIALALAHREPAQRDRWRERIDAHRLYRDLAMQCLRQPLLQLRLRDGWNDEKADGGKGGDEAGDPPEGFSGTPRPGNGTDARSEGRDRGHDGFLSSRATNNRIFVDGHALSHFGLDDRGRSL